MGLIKKQAGVDLGTRVQTWVNQLYDDMRIDPQLRGGMFVVDEDKVVKIKALHRSVLHKLINRGEDLPDYILIEFDRLSQLIDLYFEGSECDITQIRTGLYKIGPHLKNLEKIKVSINQHQEEYLFQRFGNNEWTFGRLRM